jgi:hypothetical protein
MRRWRQILRRRELCGKEPVVTRRWGGGGKERCSEARLKQRVKGRLLAGRMKDFGEEHRGHGGLFLVLENAVSSGSKLEEERYGYKAYRQRFYGRTTADIAGNYELLILLAIMSSVSSFKSLLMRILSAVVLVMNRYWYLEHLSPVVLFMNRYWQVIQ